MLGAFQNKNKKVTTWLSGQLLTPESDDCTEVSIVLEAKDLFQLLKGQVNRVVVKDGHLLVELKDNPF